MDSAFSESPLRPGFRLDRYELLCPLAQGGMALVWLARFGGKLAGFEKLVVVKTILPQYAQDPRFQRMFLDEARIAARIEHPNVARILDVGEERGTYYIVMEWVDGDSLSKLMRACDEARQPMPLGAALQIAADVCLGLEAAHTLCDAAGEPLGVVHRDVSPQNVLIGPAGEAKLIDFGVAKARDRMAQDTTAGQLKGKLRYMSPEQAKGGNLDGRADVWSVGALLYEMLTGEPPFDGPHELAILHRLVSGESPRPLPGTIPPFVRSIVERSMRYEAHERFESARAMGAALEAALMKLGEGAAHQSVASVAEAMLAGRTMQRRRTVEAALLAAQKRSQMSTRNNTNDGVVHEAYPAFAEVAPEPSHASNATLGSAALAGPPSLDSEDSERRKILGMIVVAASLLIVLSGIAIGLVFKRRGVDEADVRPVPAASAATLAGQPPATTTSTSAAPTVAVSPPPVQTGIPLTPATSAVATGAPLTAVDPPPTATAPPPATPGTPNTPPVAPPPTAPRPPATPATVTPPSRPTAPSPTPKPSGSGKRRDYGFGN